MCDDGRPRPGQIGWFDLTVNDAESLRDFYSDVVGWKPEPVDMGGYADFNMTLPDDGTPAAGICHARGPNAELPSQWLMYVNVRDLDASLARCRDLGGELVAGPRGMGDAARYAVIRDPAGAVLALFQPAEMADHDHHDHHHHDHEHGHGHGHASAHSHTHEERDEGASAPD